MQGVSSDENKYRYYQGEARRLKIYTQRATEGTDGVYNNLQIQPNAKVDRTTKHSSRGKGESAAAVLLSNDFQPEDRNLFHTTIKKAFLLSRPENHGEKAAVIYIDSKGNTMTKEEWMKVYAEAPAGAGKKSQKGKRKKGKKN